ncbi:hypothetical protein AYO21_00650 [Fonsecaea monophora]|uniref:KANL3/Tex30 alpha/beta hydrolase-like domain-containing protein n=1 Tax=Fonsecaea monophora TaxID=254056 RepID=A0A177FPM4_9EURO|nr:hypothetical protein AYO21_00650 [Fonsecaea monophora]KAH0840694.1 hypothetical protein FOPE_05867 [Fonsecaea pedrosoi]OAG45302.1 hypothetical protein AYO21_00650 [Fonsecaea monophora]
MAPRTRQGARSSAATIATATDKGTKAKAKAKSKSAVEKESSHLEETVKGEARPDEALGDEPDPTKTKDKSKSTTNTKTTPANTTNSTLPPTRSLVFPTHKFTEFTISTPSSTAKSAKSPSTSTKTIPCQRSHAAPHPTSLIFTHGAGGDLSAAAMVNFSRGFAGTGSAVVMFQGSMNVKARAGLFGVVKEYEIEHGSIIPADQDKGSPQGKSSVNVSGKKRKVTAVSTSTSTYSSSPPTPVAYGGRSMGARAAVIASHTDHGIKTLLLASYPLVSPSGAMRDQILLDIHADVDVLFISGDHDTMCPLDTLQSVRAKMKARTWRVVVDGADHGMNVRGGKKLKEGTERVGEECGRIAAEWLRERDLDRREMTVSWDGETGVVRGTVWVGGRQTGSTQEQGGTSKRANNKDDSSSGDDEKVDEAERVGVKRKRTKK